MGVTVHTMTPNIKYLTQRHKILPARIRSGLSVMQAGIRTAPVHILFG
jgi:hypothetical protein